MKYDVALNQYLRLFDDFSFREDLIPSLLYQELIKKAKVPTIVGKEFSLEPPWNRDFIDTVWCSPNFLVIRWTNKERDSSTVVYSWTGESIFEEYDKLIMLTCSYLIVLKHGFFSTKYLVISNDGKQLEMSREKIHNIFFPKVNQLDEGLSLFKFDKYCRNKMQFGNVTLEIKSENKYESVSEGYTWDAVPGSTVPHGGTYKPWKTKSIFSGNYNTLEVKFALDT